jgi:hypothetical protein
MTRTFVNLLLTCLLGLGTAAALTSSPAVAQDVAIANARIIVGNGTVIDSGTLIVRGGRIDSVSAGASDTQGLTMIDAAGLTAMPGFIDAHKHINTGPDEREQMQALLEAGYTTILSGGGPPDGNIMLRDHIESGRINGPRIIPSGRISLRDNTPERARGQVRELAAMGVKFTGEISLTPEPGPSPHEIEVLRAVLDEAEQAGVTVQVHAVSTPAMVAAIETGARRLVHLPNKDWVSRDAAQKLAATNTMILGTIGFGAPVFGVFAEDNMPRFRDGEAWPEAIAGANRDDRQRSHGLGPGRHPRLLHGHGLRAEGGPRARAAVVQCRLLDAGHRRAHGAEHSGIHQHGRRARNTRGGQARRHCPAGRQPHGRLLEHAERQSRAEGRRRTRRQALTPR